ncbi:MAG: SDR family oxidoreductase [Sandaracinaceae bacterium]|nr:SDR family oxidoreductase [Sandaracinaceae bacterium]
MFRIVITGANRGIGLELARARHEHNDIVALVREPSDELRALGARIIDGVDVTDQASVEAAAAELEDVDVLINNAGLLRSSSLAHLDWPSIEAQMQVDAFGPLRVSAALAPKIKDGGKIAIVTSRMGSLADNTSGGAYGYRMSKCAVNMVAVSLSRDLASRGISVGLVHPGFVRTQMTGGNGHIDPDAAAAMIWERIDELDLENTGTFWHANGEVLPW